MQWTELWCSAKIRPITKWKQWSKTLSSFWEITMPGQIVALITRREEQKEMEAGKFQVYIVLDMAMYSRKFSVQKWVGFLAASWPQREAQSYSWGGITRLSYMHYASSGKCSLMGSVTTLLTRLSTAGGQRKKYVMVVGLLFPYLPNAPLRAHMVASLSARGLAWNIPTLLLSIPRMFSGNIQEAVLLTLEIILFR